MKTWLKNYLAHYLRDAAIGILVAPIKGFEWKQFISELKEVAWGIVTLLVLLLLIATWPLSPIVIAAICCERDRRRSRVR